MQQKQYYSPGYKENIYTVLICNGVELEDDLNMLANGRRPKYLGKWKMTFIFLKVEDDLNIVANGR